MHIAYYAGIVKLFCFLNRKAKKIVTFHNVLPDELFADNLANASALPVSKFREIVKWMSGRFEFSVDLRDVSTVTIAFDDGYCCQAEIAGAVLHECGNLPAIIFGAGKALRADCPERALVIDKLLLWTSHAPLEALSEYKGTPVNDRVGEFWCKKLWHDYCNDGASFGENVCRRLNEIYPFSKIFEGLDGEYLRLRMTGICGDLQKELESRGWMLAWHTENHHPLSFLSEEASRQEMTPPNAGLLKLPFSYPYGSLETVSPRDELIASELGYPCAVSNTSPNERERKGRYFMARLSLANDWVENECVMSGFKYFLESGKLMKAVWKHEA